MHRAEFVHQFLDLEKERIKAWGGIRSMIKVIQFYKNAYIEF